MYIYIYIYIYIFTYTCIYMYIHIYIISSCFLVPSIAPRRSQFNFIFLFKYLLLLKVPTICSTQFGCRHAYFEIYYASKMS